MVSRRGLIAGSALLGAQGAIAAAVLKNIAISSSNGLRACAKAVELMRGGADTLDAVVAGVAIQEDDPEDNSVGYGGLPNELGVVELDASVMHGPTRRCGAVASLRNIKNPSRVAKMVMEFTDHVMLVGEGALQFARAHGVPEENLLTEKSRLAWLVWRQSLRDGKGHSNWSDGLDAPVGRESKVPAALKRLLPGVDPEVIAWAREVAIHPPTGTINCLALNTKGEMSGCTTTSGLAWKIPGRVGDSPIIGAGLFVDPDVGGAGSTGRGEENIRVAGAHTVVENMRRGMDPKAACLEALKRVAKNYGGDRERLGQFDINFYALTVDGQYAGASLWNGVSRRSGFEVRQFTVNDGGQSRSENCAYLYERK